MNKLKLYRLSVGHNNATKKLEIKKIKEITDSFFEGYSLLQGLGRYKGGQEKTAFINIATNETKKVLELTAELKAELQQDAIMISEIGTASFL